MSVKDDFNAALLELAWSAWGEFGVSAGKKSHSNCALDLELLIAFTEHLDDPRLADETQRAIARMKPYLSTSRLLKARRALPGGVELREETTTARRRPELAPLRLRKPSLIQLRLRAIVGNSARSEILLVLLLKQPAAVSLSEITDRTLLVKSIIAKAADEMRDAGLLEATADRNRLRFTIADQLAANTLVGTLPSRAPDWLRLFSMLLDAKAAFAAHGDGSLSLTVALTKVAESYSKAMYENLPRGSDALTRARIARAWADAARAIASGKSSELNVSVTRGDSFNVDPLTGLLNRRAIQSHLVQMLAAPKPAAFMMMDIDHFKKLNDEYGHALGDGVLSQLGQIIAERCAEDDLAVACRYGGEEFLIATNREAGDAEAFAESIRAQVAATKFTVQGRSVEVTISIGLATSEAHRESLDVQEQIERADEALYQAKLLGRNALAVAATEDDLAASRTAR